MTAKAVQLRLKAAGFDPGPIDGEIGDRTLAALAVALAAAKGQAAAWDENDALLASELERDEGFVPHVYQDSLGYYTIGIGRLVDRRKRGGITHDEALLLKRNDIARFKGELDRLAPWWRTLDPVRQRAMLNITFNMGEGWLAKFHSTVAHIIAGRWPEAADGLRNSLWAKQVGARAERVAKMIETGQA